MEAKSAGRERLASPFIILQKIRELTYSLMKANYLDMAGKRLILSSHIHLAISETYSLGFAHSKLDSVGPFIGKLLN